MVNIIKSVSVTDDEDRFIKDYNLSPTQLLKEKIWEMRGMVKTMIEQKIQTMQQRILEQADTIESLRNALEEKNKTGADSAEE